MYREILGSGIAERAHANQIRELLACYESLSKDGATVSYADLNLATLDAYRDQLMILFPHGEDDYIYMHYGRDIARASGFNMTGERVRSLQTQIATFFTAVYERVRKEGRPLYTIHRSVKSLRVSMWERLIMPVKTSTGGDILIVFNAALHIRDELLGAILDSSPDGIVAFQPVRDDAGEMVDAMVMTANRKAAEITHVPLEQLIDKGMLELFPNCKESGTWDRYKRVLDSRAAETFETFYPLNGSKHWFRVHARPMGEGFLVTFSDISELKNANLALESQAQNLADQIGHERRSREEMEEEISARELIESELRRIADADTMTGVMNRRSFMERCEKAASVARTRQHVLSVIVLDIDHFKTVNDTYGHAAGDAVIVAMVERLSSNVRASDMLARVGGEEFSICLPKADTNAAIRVAEDLRRRVCSEPIPLPEGMSITITASFGVATLRAGETIHDLIARADRALYVAKQTGRNRVASAPENDAVVSAA
jgi:diguanylate cyclase (GGDEF)-like protein/PAS domain S-box-containing protein